MMAASRSAACLSFPGMAWAYQLSVMLASACPRRAWTVFTSTPLPSKRVACVWRSSWNLSPSKPLPSRNDRHQRSKLLMLMKPPVVEQQTGVSGVWRMPNFASSAACRAFHRARCPTVLRSTLAVRVPPRSSAPSGHRPS